MKFAKKNYRINLSEKVDILIAGTGTWTTWAAVNTLFIAEFLVKNNGIVVLFAKCTDGISPEHPDIIKYCYIKI